MNKHDAHELYMRLTDIQAQLESNIGDENELEAEKAEIANALAAAGYDPESEPESLYPENQ